MPRITTLPLADLLLGVLANAKRPQANNCATGRPQPRDDRFTRSTPKPRPSSRRLHAGHRLANQQAPARLIPGLCLCPGFDVVFPVSTRHQRFTHVRLLDPHLTRSRRAFSATLSTPALDRRTLRWFAASPYRAATKGHQPSGQLLHLRCSTASRTPIFYIATPSTLVFTQAGRVGSSQELCRHQRRSSHAYEDEQY